jgi:hypothetical protein
LWTSPCSLNRGFSIFWVPTTEKSVILD